MTIVPKFNLSKNIIARKTDFLSLVNRIPFYPLQNFRTDINFFHYGHLFLEIIMFIRSDFAQYFYKRSKIGREEQFLLDLLPASRSDIFVFQLTTLVEDQVARKINIALLSIRLVSKGFSTSAVFRKIEVLVTDFIFLVRFVFFFDYRFFSRFCFIITFKK